MKIIHHNDYSIVRLVQRALSPFYIEFISFSHPDCDPNELYILSQHIGMGLGAPPIEATGLIKAIFVLFQEQLSPFLLQTLIPNPLTGFPEIRQYYSCAGAIQIAELMNNAIDHHKALRLISTIRRVQCI